MLPGAGAGAEHVYIYGHSRRRRYCRLLRRRGVQTYSFVDIDIIFAFNYMNIKNGSVEHMCPQSGADPCADQ